MKRTYADKQTDKELAKLEKRLAKEYRTAWEELSEKANKYFERFEDLYQKKYEELLSGTISKLDFDMWYRSMLSTGKRWTELRDQMADRMTNANKVACSMINDKTPSIYTLNHNYSLYEIEKGSNAVFTLANENVVKRLAQDKNHVNFRVNSVNRKRDYEWNQRKINNCLMQGILQGESPSSMANRFFDVMKSNRTAAIRNARTSFTSAQNGGRMDAWEKASDMGFHVMKEWMCTLDDRTRDSHIALDGERVELNEPFSNGCMCPADPTGDPSEVYNCRCTMLSYIPELSDDDRRETYNEWLSERDNDGGAQKDTFGVLKEEKIVYNKVYKHTEIPSADNIIKMISGADKTKGSCASVALAYIGQKHGCNVLDFRGGKSRDYFSRKQNKLKMWKDVGANYRTFDKYKSNLINGLDAVTSMIEGKEYYLSVGKHASIVRAYKNTEGEIIYQYLELQSKNKNGWTNFSNDPKETLKNRFKCNVRTSGYIKAHLTEIGQLKDNADFEEILGYINTEGSKQKKGAGGYAK